MAQGYMIRVGLGVSRAWHTRAKFQAWKHLGGRWGAESLDPGQDGEPQDVREERGGPHSPAWSQAAIGLPSRGGFIMARIASGEGARSRLGSLSSSDWTHRRREEAQVSGLTPGRRAHTPGELPPFTP